MRRHDVKAIPESRTKGRLLLAVNGRANVLVTGDLDLLVLNPFRGLPIVTPRVFVNEFARSS